MDVHSKDSFLPARPAIIHIAKRLRHALIMLLVAVAVIASMECIVFNMPFWRTLGASTDTNAVHNSLGSGLKRTDDGMLTVTDPTNAYLELTADGTSDFLRIDTVSNTVIEQAKQSAHEQSQANNDAEVFSPVHAIHVRIDIDGNTGSAQSLSPASERSHYLKASGAGIVRVWIQEERGAIVPISDARANVKVPFAVNWMRVAAMALVLILIALWRPGSKLWRITLNPASARQRLAFAAIMAIPVVAFGSSIIWQLLYATPLAFHTAGGYTYDFDQYAHVADSLIAGRPWLDLEVPSQLTQVENPYDVATRLQLLQDGVSPIYWDYAYYNGHWYSYFGVVPAALLYAPYRLITGRVLPTGAAEQFLVLLFIIFFSMLMLRLIHRVMPKTSIAAASLTVVSGLLGAQVGYLAYRTNFYQVPFAASLALTSLGLWFWLGADTSSRPLLAADRWRAGDAAPLSLPRLALGSVCIAANFGCRPTFTLAALLAFPLFWPQIRAMISDLIWRSVKPVTALRAPAALIIPAIVVVAPLMMWNKVRFGSVLNFGNAYQFTVSDMTQYATPAVDMPYMIWYYLLLPLRFTHQFPWLALSPAPMPTWGYYEVMVGSLFTATPLMLLALVLPFLKNLETHGMRPLLLSCLVLAGALVIFDGSVGGLGWRYLADFGWLAALAAVPGTLWLVNGREPSRSLAGANDAASGDGIAHVTPWRWLMRWVLLLSVLCTIAITLLSCFVPGRDDALITNNPALWHDVQSWFSLL